MTADTVLQAASLADKVKSTRLDKGMSVSTLSQLSGWSRSYIHQVERGIYTNPSLDRIRCIAKALEVDAHYFMEEV